MEKRTPSKPSGQYGSSRSSRSEAVRELKPRVPYTQKKGEEARRARSRDEGGTGKSNGGGKGGGLDGEKDEKRDASGGRKEEGLT